MTARVIDGHVHFLGNGDSGSGCEWRMTGLYQRVLVPLSLRRLGLAGVDPRVGPPDALVEDYLLERIAASDLDAVVLLAQDRPRHEPSGDPLPDALDFYVPNEHIIALAARHPDRVIPACSIHPARPDAMEELERCIDAGVRVLKLLPNHHNVGCSDPRYGEFWQRMADAGMIFLAHVGGEASLRVVNAAYADPRVLRLPLDLGVTVVAAHCAGRSFLDRDYTGVLFAMFRAYGHLHADISALCSPVRATTLRRVLARPEFHDRLVHGSDFPIPVDGLGPWRVGLLKRTDWKTIDAKTRENPLQRDLAYKRAMGVPEKVFRRWDELLGVTVGE